MSQMPEIPLFQIMKVKSILCILISLSKKKCYRYFLKTLHKTGIQQKWKQQGVNIVHSKTKELVRHWRFKKQIHDTRTTKTMFVKETCLRFSVIMCVYSQTHMAIALVLIAISDQFRTLFMYTSEWPMLSTRSATG